MNTIQEQLTAAEAANQSGNYAEAEAICRDLLAEELQPEKRIAALLVLSQSLLHRSLAKEVLPFTQEILSLVEDTEEQETKATVFTNIGTLYWQLSEYNLALHYYQQSLTIAEKSGSKLNMAKNFSNIGNVYYNLSEYPRALEYYSQAMTINKDIDRKNGMAINLGSMGNVYLNLADSASALECYHQAIAIYEEIGNKGGMAINLGNIGLVYEKLSDYVRSLEYHHRALAMNEKLGNKIATALNFGNIGVVQAKTDFIDYNPPKAEEYLLQSIAIFEEFGAKYHLYQIYKHLSDLYAQEKRWQEHAEYLQKYYETEKEVQTEESKKQADKFAFERQIAVMEKEREVTDMLLHKFLPSPIVNDVKVKEGKILVEKYESVSVLFADLVGFTKLSLQIPPEVMIEMLNFIFTKFDTIIKEVDGHRIRTMGDGYFAVCGAPDRVEQHQYKLAKAALRFMEDIFLPETIKKHLPEGTVLDIRIGLHCGQAVCGMVGGLEKWQYDIYGDTVNTASRMESHGEPGKIHISEDFKHALADYPEFTFLARSPLSIKGKGMMNTYFLA